MVKNFLIPAVLFLMLFNCGNVLKTSYTLADGIEDGQTDKQKAPDFTLYDTGGKEITLSDYAGKVVILDFWATWCGPCRMSIPDLVSIQSKYKDDLVVIGISLDDNGTQTNIPSVVESLGINYPVVFGTMQVVNDYGNINAIPTSFIIDQSGNIIKTYVGLVPKETIEDELKKLLDKS